MSPFSTASLSQPRNPSPATTAANKQLSSTRIHARQPHVSEPCKPLPHNGAASTPVPTSSCFNDHLARQHPCPNKSLETAANGSVKKKARPAPNNIPRFQTAKQPWNASRPPKHRVCLTRRPRPSRLWVFHIPAAAAPARCTSFLRPAPCDCVCVCERVEIRWRDPPYLVSRLASGPCVYANACSAASGTSSQIWPPAASSSGRGRIGAAVPWKGTLL